MNGSGMKLEVDENLVRPVIEAEIKSAIIAEFNKTPDLIHKVAVEILNHKVDSDGKPSSYSYATTYLSYLATKAIGEATKDALKEYIDDHKSELKLEIEKQLAKNKKEIATALLKALLDATENRWRFNVSLSIPE